MAYDKLVDSATLDATFTSIADAIRAKTGSTELIADYDMAEQIPGVYESGYTEGETAGYSKGQADGIEQGKQSEYDAFWDTFQNNGNPTNYYYKFSYTGWTDENFNPKYDIVCTTGTTAGMALFFANKAIRDTKVPIVVQGTFAQSMFGNAERLVTVRKLVLHEGVKLPTIFVNCVALTNLTIEGTIGDNIDLQYSPLTKASIISVINALSSTKSGLTATFRQSAVINAFGSTTAEEWTNLIATKSNWTISLV